ncbi:MAG: SDR family NAD(P)-dependent oxidoreductase [Paracoccus sp. (in: a-proteobacteria)]|uniref:SDR family NAD(P)-dependent oxidoreductase n=1 Tax=Paracoccus sp. TaxID=267 RepID=UPI0026E07A73|nr:SDR family NAD(P)-dependent oxidoreductase [Paracoccus sp. (in: a-proteobacteria)]MDO5620683.1 SDR family NAD(P)-dependent oxidoreductase [Paracoccus sp. (in: a-proteobacteria)]
MKRVLLTGCSSGIGLGSAHYLRAHGWQVVAACRAAADVAARQAEGFESVALDLDDSASITRAVDRVLTAGPLDALVNNAAFALPGAVEDIPREALRAIFETNLFGTHDLTRRLLPHFRERGAGRVVNISSVLGLVGIPWRGPYAATKFALEGLTDILRLEMADTGIHIVLIEPGPIASRIRANSIPHFERWIDWQNSPRAAQYRTTLLDRLYHPKAKKDRFELQPEAVARRILHALDAPRPRPRYYVTTPTWLAGIGRRLLPTRALDALARRS